MSRIEILVNIIKMKGNLSKLSQELTTFSWDAKQELVVLKQEDLIHILRLFLDGKIQDSEVEEWANIIECREDIDFESLLIKKTVEELANPYITEQLTKYRANTLINNLLR